jgi:hypothetical protein
MYTYEATVKIGNNLVKTRVAAANAHNAKLLLQQQYGAASVIGFVVQV